MTNLERDQAIIEALGGPAKVAELIKLERFGTQQVCNWMVRGIPARIKVKHPDLFMPELAEKFGCKFPEPGAQQPSA